MLKAEMTLNVRASVSEGVIGLVLLKPNSEHDYGIRIAASEKGEVVKILLQREQRSVH